MQKEVLTEFFSIECEKTGIFRTNFHKGLLITVNGKIRMQNRKNGI